MNPPSHHQQKLTNSFILKLNEIEGRLQKIEAINSTVENNQQWEKSGLRIIAIMLLTYVVMVFSMRYLGFDRPFLSGLIPALGYFLSALLLDVIRRVFIDRIDK